MDHFMKQMLVLNESAVVRSREYTNGKQKDFETLIGTKLEPLNDKIFRFYVKLHFFSFLLQFL